MYIPRPTSEDECYNDTNNVIRCGHCLRVATYKWVAIIQVWLLLNMWSLFKDGYY